MIYDLPADRKHRMETAKKTKTIATNKQHLKYGFTREDFEDYRKQNQTTIPDSLGR